MVCQRQDVGTVRAIHANRLEPSILTSLEFSFICQRFLEVGRREEENKQAAHLET